MRSSESSEILVALLLWVMLIKLRGHEVAQSAVSMFCEMCTAWKAPPTRSLFPDTGSADDILGWEVFIPHPQLGIRITDTTNFYSKSALMMFQIHIFKPNN